MYINDGVGDFSQEAGHLVIEARTHTSVYRDIIFAGGINNASDLMTITGEGNVGIGTRAPDLTLHIDGTNALPATSRTTPNGMLTLRAKSGSSSHGLFMGVSIASPWGS